MIRDTFFSQTRFVNLCRKEMVENWKSNLLRVALMYGAMAVIMLWSGYFFYSSVYGGLSSIVFNFLLIPLWGIWGAVLSVVLSFMVMSVSRVAYSWTYVKLTHIPRLLLMLLLTCIYIVSVCLTGSANSLVAGFITIGLLLLLNCDLLHLLKRKIIKRYIAK